MPEFDEFDAVVERLIQHLLNSYSDQTLKHIVAEILHRRPGVHELVGASIHRKVKPFVELDAPIAYHWTDEIFVTRIRGGESLAIEPWKLPKRVTNDMAAYVIGADPDILKRAKGDATRNRVKTCRVESSDLRFAVERHGSSGLWEILILEE